MRGSVTSQGAAVAGARVTLISSDGTTFREVRSDAAGAYSIQGLGAGSYTVGASAIGLEYQEAGVTLVCTETIDFALGSETQPGSWESLGDPGERFGGTNSGVLLPDGRIMYCHNTIDPVIFDPVSGVRTRPPGSERIQGCHGVTLRPDGQLIYVGGADQEVYGPGTRQVKTFDPVSETWQVQNDLVGARWYPSLVPLPDGTLLAAGGGGVDNPLRVKTTETMDPTTMTWTSAGDIAIGNEVSPIVLLYTGDVLMTHRPPQLYNPATRSWSSAADFVQGNRMPNGDHSDHEMVLLPDGRVAAIGYKSFLPGVVGNLLEIYDPETNQWSLGANSAPVRSRASTLLLPDGRVLVLAGYKEDMTDPTPVNEWGFMSLTDLYDPATDRWRRLADMGLDREYHAMPILVPDGRVIITGGEGQPGNEPDMSTLQAFSPPYLFRGPRPEIHGLASTTLARGDTITFQVARTAAPTKVILQGTIATTHFMDSGNGRYLELEFTQSDDQVSARIPTDPNRAVFGYYMLFVLVDDIPSIGQIVRIDG